MATSVWAKGGEDLLLLMVEGEGEGDVGSFFLVGSEKYLVAAKKVAELLGGKGGGKGNKFQGKGTKIRSMKDNAIAFLKEHVKKCDNAAV